VVLGRFYNPSFPALFSLEQTPIPDIPPHHLHGPMPGLRHDAALRCPRNRRVGGIARP
jgi:hypothetical protein